MLQDVIHTFFYYIVTILSFALVMIIIRYTLKVNNELFRKLLHLAAFSSIALITHFASSWQAATIVALVFAAIILPFLKLFEKIWKGYSNLFVQRRSGEVAVSLVILFTMMAAVIAFSWGFLGKPYLGVTAVFMWGFGDAAAALVGIKYGKHKTNIPFADKKKSWEGSFAMFIAAAISGFISLYFSVDLSIWRILLATLITGIAASYTELITKNGYDTVTVPIVNMIFLYLLLCI